MSDRIHVGTRKGLFTVVRKPSGWQIDRVDFLGSPVTMTLYDARNNMLYAVLTLGHFGAKLHRSSDGGQTWEECAVPVYPEGAVYGGPPGADGKPTTKPASLSEIWILEPGGADQGDWLWAGTIPGGLFTSQDRGTSWQLVESLFNHPDRLWWFGGGKDEPGIHSVCVHPQDSRRVLVGVSCGSVWATADGGGSWECRGQGLRAEYMPPGMEFNTVSQDPHRLVRCAAAPDHLWIQHHNGIFKSTNEGRQWDELHDVQPSNFGFAVAVHPQDPHTAWFVPAQKDQFRVPVNARLVVNHTTDGGRTFRQLSAGLPGTHCYDIIYRHGLEVDATGTRLTMGSTTGGLWVSEDAGESWITISQTLPPIYCTRFAG